jgi:four helix bundle protein
MKSKGGEELADLKTRTKAFALRVIRLYGALPKTTEAQVIGKQVLRSGTSVGAHYREASRSRSSAEFVSKVQGALMELEESSYWLELLSDAAIVPADRLLPLQDEVLQLTAIMVTCIKNVKQRGMNEERWPSKGGSLVPRP